MKKKFFLHFIIILSICNVFQNTTHSYEKTSVTLKSDSIPDDPQKEVEPSLHENDSSTKAVLESTPINTTAITPHSPSPLMESPIAILNLIKQIDPLIGSQIEAIRVLHGEDILMKAEQKLKTKPTLQKYSPFLSRFAMRACAHVALRALLAFIVTATKHKPDQSAKILRDAVLREVKNATFYSTDRDDRNYMKFSLEKTVNLLMLPGLQAFWEQNAVYSATGYLGSFLLDVVALDDTLNASADLSNDKPWLRFAYVLIKNPIIAYATNWFQKRQETSMQQTYLEYQQEFLKSLDSMMQREEQNQPLCQALLRLKNSVQFLLSTE